MAILVVNVGLRDVKAAQSMRILVNNEEMVIPKTEGNESLPRGTMQALGNFLKSDQATAQQRKMFYLPILSSYVDYIQNERHEELNKLVLFGTQQSDAKHAKDDTFPVAEAIKKYKMDFGLPSHTVVQTERIELNPAILDSLFPFYEQRLAEKAAGWFSSSTSKTDNEHVIFGLTGGTPQMNMGMLLGAAQLTGNISFLHKPENGFVQKLEFMSQIRFRALSDKALAASERSAYQMVQELFSEDPFFPDEVSLVRDLAAYAVERMNGNLDKATNLLRSLQSRQGKIHNRRVRSQLIDTVDHWLAELYDLQHDANECKRLFEVLFQAELFARQKLYIPMVVLLGSFREQALRLFVVQKGVQFTKDGKFFDGKWYDSQSGLQEYLNTYSFLLDGKPKKQAVDIRREVNQFSLMAIARYLVHDDNSDLATLQVLDPLIKLRNDIVHKIEGVSQEAVNARLQMGCQDISNHLFSSNEPELEELFPILTEMVGRLSTDEIPVSSSPNPYDEVHKLIQNLLQPG